MSLGGGRNRSAIDYLYKDVLTLAQKEGVACLLRRRVATRFCRFRETGKCLPKSEQSKILRKSVTTLNKRKMRSDENPGNKVFIEKPWGHERILVHTDKYAAKVLFVNIGKRLSRQYHKIKKESLIYLSGDGYIEINEGNHSFSRDFGEGAKPITIEPGVIHRICARKGTHLELMEISTPEIDDVVRLEDDWGRT